MHDRDRLGDIGLAAALPDPLLVALHGEGGDGDDRDAAVVAGGEQMVDDGAVDRLRGSLRRREMDAQQEEPVVIYHSHTASEAYPSKADIELLDHLRNLGGGVWNANLLIREAHQALVRLRRASVLIEDLNKDIDLILADKLTDLGVLGQRVEEIVRLSRYERRFRGRLDRLIRTAMKLDRDRHRACPSLAN